MVKKTLFFVAGVTTGVVSVPVTLLYVKPIRTSLIRSFAKLVTKRLSDDAGLRKDAIAHCELFAEVLKAYPED